MGFFDKYQDALTPRPNGRPVGVLNGQGQQPVTAGNPALSGLAQAVNGAQGMLGNIKAPQPQAKPYTPGIQPAKPSEFGKRAAAMKSWSSLS